MSLVPDMMGHQNGIIFSRVTALLPDSDVACIVINFTHPQRSLRQLFERKLLSIMVYRHYL